MLSKRPSVHFRVADEDLNCVNTLATHCPGRGSRWRVPENHPKESCSRRPGSVVSGTDEGTLHSRGQKM